MGVGGVGVAALTLNGVGGDGLTIHLLPPDFEINFI